MYHMCGQIHNRLPLSQSQVRETLPLQEPDLRKMSNIERMDINPGPIKSQSGCWLLPWAKDSSGYGKIRQANGP